jgi:hypothetical protein
MHRLALCLAGVLALAACAAPPRHRIAVTPRGPVRERPEPNVPDYASKPYESFSRDAVVAITLREWRVFGQPVDDDPPGTRPPPLPDQKPERFEGLWQRVGDYWYQGQNLDEPEASWTGKHDAWGTEFPADEDDAYAWSAAFVSYVMRIAGAGGRFPYSPAHHTYIDAAWRMANGQDTGWVVTAFPIDAYAPVAGDLICTSRTAVPVRYADLPRGDFPAHCDIVVAQSLEGQSSGLLSVIGGNVDDAVTMKHVPVTAAGMLGTSADSPLDSRYPWFVVLRVTYDVPTAARQSGGPKLAQR